MDKALDEVIGERQRENRSRGGARNRRRDNWARDGARKNGDGRSNIDDDWIHDKYQDEEEERRVDRRPPRNRGYRERESLLPDSKDQDAKIRVENLHYDLTEDDLEDLFTRIAPISNLTLTYDRAGRSTGTAYVTYRTSTSAQDAIREFDGANAFGQPIRLSLAPSGPSGRSGRNPFDTVTKPGRSLFDRIESSGRGRDRSRSPRRSDVSKPPPEGIDRYVPGDRSRSPPRRRRDDHGDIRNSTRRGEGARHGGSKRDDARRATVQGRPRMTQEELDRDMDDYWKKKDSVAIASSGVEPASAPTLTAATTATANLPDDDIDMAE